MTVPVLIVGATGFQGRAVIQSLVSLHDNPFHILALTRNSASPTAQSLLSVGVKDGKEDSQVELVQGNLDEKDSIRTIFEQQKEKGGIWGVFVALAFPGLGVNADGEQQQGIVRLSTCQLSRKTITMIEDVGRPCVRIQSLTFHIFKQRKSR